MSRPLTGFLVTSLFLLVATSALAQGEKTDITPEEKAERIVQRGLKAVGGDRYLAVKTSIGKGFFTEFHDGVSGVPIRFLDYIAYPDKERTEFTGGGARTIQTNFKGGGWIYDGAALTLKDQTPAQLDEFKLVTRVTLENLLHGWWKAQGAKLSYAGRREAATIGRRNEAVRLTYEDGFWVEYEFAADDGIPVKVLYQRQQKIQDSDETEAIKEEDRLHKLINIDGVMAPYIIDHFRNGIQTSRINYESVEYNKPLADTLFAKPASFKAVK